MQGGEPFNNWWATLVAMIAVVGSLVTIGATIENWLLTARRRKQHETLTAMRDAEPDATRAAIINRSRTWVVARQVGAQGVPSHRMAVPAFVIAFAAAYVAQSAMRDPWWLVATICVVSLGIMFYAGGDVVRTISARAAVIAAFLASNDTDGEVSAPSTSRPESHRPLLPKEKATAALFAGPAVAAPLAVGVIVRQSPSPEMYVIVASLIFVVVLSLATMVVISYPRSDTLDPRPDMHDDDRRDDA